MQCERGAAEGRRLDGGPLLNPLESRIPRVFVCCAKRRSHFCLRVQSVRRKWSTFHAWEETLFGIFLLWQFRLPCTVRPAGVNATNTHPHTHWTFSSYVGLCDYPLEVHRAGRVFRSCWSSIELRWCCTLVEEAAERSEVSVNVFKSRLKGTYDLASIQYI